MIKRGFKSAMQMFSDPVRPLGISDKLQTEDYNQRRKCKLWNLKELLILVTMMDLFSSSPDQDVRNY